MLRSSLRSSTRTLTQRCSVSCAISVQSRSLVYVNTSSSASSSSAAVSSTKTDKRPARGIKKSLDAILVANGVRYPGNAETLAAVESFLGTEYALPPELVLQVLTHKSFAHGLKPYNENLAIIGRHFLRLVTVRYASQQESSNPGAINGHNLDVALARISSLMSGTPVTSELCTRLGIDKHIFWKDPSIPEGSSRSAPVSATVRAKSIDALVGAILLKLGQFKAQTFVETKLLTGPNSLIAIAKSVYE
ncbi:mitochondrial 54S ribosomal protein mL57 [Magnusiomyces paraingens]|uniref:RNase III domain-containing protein n=1 Tax=Magnusiomyces paraingens TaxID=2606893 RepID=A0A5E8BE17_9ASCO|nr:uncharacterized protein SAPINGB_P002199 [Saprochaete ingens]VVT49293.1 unnamed protein product [Saprochaete ingens]